MVAALTAAATPAQATPTPSPTASAGTAQSAAKAGPPKTITLITGDKVTLRPLPGEQTQLSVTPGAGRENIAFIHRRGQDGLSIVPADAMPLLAAGRLDSRLFNVTRLAAFGYDDAASPALPLIVTYPADVATLRVAGGHPLPAINAIAQSERHDAAGTLWKSLTAQARTSAATPEKIWLDGKAKLSLDVSVPHIGAPQAWQAGYDGKDVPVAVLDTGYDPGHPDLQGLVVKTANFTAEPDVRDLNGHGTHVASTIAGSGAASGGRYKGVAPGAKLLIGKVCEQGGYCPDSGIIEGMTWAAENGARVANLSLGNPDAPGLDPLEQAVDTLSEKYGTLFVIASGNDGPRTLGSPSSADRALSVGASFRDNDSVVAFSSTGPRPGDAAVKPDLIAPGVGIVAARAEGTGFPADDESYTEMSGTSMATPHVTGAAAIVAGRHPDWKADQIKAALMASTAPGAELGAYVQGSGRVDVARAVTQQVTAEPAPLSLGDVQLPAAPGKRTLTYRNDGDAAVRLDLSIVAKDGRGQTVTPFTLSASSVEVPAHGTAQVEVSTAAQPTGLYSGTVIATGGSVSVRTAIGMEVVPEKRKVKLTFTGSDGRPAQAALAGVIDLDTKEQSNYDVATGTLELKLDKGHRYTVVTLLLDQDGAVVMGADPEFTLDADRAFTSDARKSRPVDVRTEEPSARLAFGMLGMLQVVDGVQPLGVDVDLPAGADRVDGIKAIPTARTASEKFAYYRWTQWAKPKSGGGFDDSPYFYHLMKAEPRIPADPGYRPRRRDLAQVDATYAAQADGKQGERFALPVLYGTELAWMPYGEVSRFPLPFHRTEYYTPADTGWYSTFVQYRVPPDGFDNLDQFFYDKIRSYRAGEKISDRWNGGVFGAALDPGGDYSWREGNALQFSIGLFKDGVPEHFSYDSYVNPKATLYRDGKEVWAAEYLPGYIEVPADAKAGKYRLAVSADREPLRSKLSTRVSAEWRFGSTTPEQGKRPVLPLMAVKIAPELDDRNRADVGHMRIPLQIQRQKGSPALKVNALTLDISYDDGRTWLPALVHRTGDGTWAAETSHPRNARGKFASLRVKAADTGDNAFTETIIRAYEIK
ncbi:serine protease [Sphaerisporangium melleum]|uniref:Serine protease n=1 Tax=Sphaerisporangium melleum TaxID=321316 RepID=A0A917VLY5_9ACTN|nr:S8 family serine peptidase [Sphaerisporangium melleum]GGK94425.1 serine protease [Sphaerisporangium melleum]GII73242.1 serine protease [Sphaerisporangium melleum]